MHLRLAVPRPEELAVLCAFFGSVQLLVAAKAMLSVRRRGPSWPAPPSARVYVTCKGAPPSFLENARALRAQRYPGAWSLVFVTPDPGDPAAAALRGLKDGGPPPEVLSSGVVPERSSGQAADLVWALAADRPTADVLVFADADGLVGEDWLAELVAPLADPKVGVSSVGAVPVPRSLGAAALLRMPWVAGGLPFFSDQGLVCGQSMAVARRDFSDWGTAAAWSRCVGDDFVLARLAQAWERRPRVAFRALPADREDPAGFWAVLNKWAVYFRVHAPGLWTLAVLGTAFKLYCAYRGLWPQPRPVLLAALWGLDAAYLFLVMAWLARLRPGAFEGLPGGVFTLAASAALGAVTLPWVYLVNLAASLTDTVRWSGRTYRIYGPLDVRVEGG